MDSSTLPRHGAADMHSGKEGGDRFMIGDWRSEDDASHEAKLKLRRGSPVEIEISMGAAYARPNKSRGHVEAVVGVLDLSGDVSSNFVEGVDERLDCRQSVGECMQPMCQSCLAFVACRGDQKTA